MRIPRAKVYRAFRELDALDDRSCMHLVRSAMINHETLVFAVPRIVLALVAALWPAGWIVARWLRVLPAWVPVPATWTGATIVLAVTTVLVASLAFLVARDVCLWLGLRRELRRAHCRKCGQSMVGLPIRAAGDDNDPGKRFVRCAECGKLHNLLEAGITPRDLIPYEQREAGEVGAFLRTGLDDARETRG